MRDEMISLPAVVPWEYLEEAAASLFDIWTDRFDLKSAELIWNDLPKIDPESEIDGLACARSFVVLAALARITGEFAGVACDEYRRWGDLRIADAFEAMKVDAFFLGQLVGSSVTIPEQEIGHPDLTSAVTELATAFVQPIVRRLRTTYSSSWQLLGILARPYHVERKRTGSLHPVDEDEPPEMSRVNVERVLAWIDMGCPI